MKRYYCCGQCNGNYTIDLYSCIHYVCDKRSVPYYRPLNQYRFLCICDLITTSVQNYNAKYVGWTYGLDILHFRELGKDKAEELREAYPQVRIVLDFC